jgi:tetratricopeptide (TPR) repeat protein
MRALAALVGATAIVIAAELDAQRLGPEVRRPRLTAGADTNDALAYLELGMSTVAESPDAAADAFYWAARLDPSAPGALHGRRIALLTRRQQTLTQYFQGGRRARENSQEFRALDSLQQRAMHLDPLMFRMLDRTLLFTYYYNSYRRRGGSLGRREFDRELLFELQSEPPAVRAWSLYGAGQFDQAIAQYDIAIRESRDPVNLHIERARTLSLRSRDAEAISGFERAIELLTTRDARRGEYVVFYDSKALLHHSIGVLYVRQNQQDSAPAAFGRAMEEDVSFWPPHVALGRLALSQHDSVTAVAELGLAATLATDEPYIQYVYGEMLLATAQPADAVEPLRAAIALEPYYAAPHFLLAEALAAAGDPAGARTHYERFLALSSMRDGPRRATATSRLAALAR